MLYKRVSVENITFRLFWYNLSNYDLCDMRMFFHIANAFSKRNGQSDYGNPVGPELSLRNHRWLFYRLLGHFSTKPTHILTGIFFFTVSIFHQIKYSNAVDHVRVFTLISDRTSISEFFKSTHPGRMCKQEQAKLPISLAPHCKKPYPQTIITCSSLGSSKLCRAPCECWSLGPGWEGRDVAPLCLFLQRGDSRPA